MRTKFIALVLIGITLVIVGTLNIKSRSQEQELLALQESKDRDTINWHIRRAKVEGKRKVVLPGPHILYGDGVGNVGEALNHYGVLIAEPIEKKSYIHEDEEIVTWYKLRIRENLSQRNLPKCTACGNPEKWLPQEMLPLNPDEILIQIIGGTVTSNGVEVIMVNNQLPEFSLYQEYMLFLSGDESGRIGFLNMGSTGIFAITPDGKVKPIVKKAHPFIMDVKTHYNQSLERLRTHIRSRSSLR